MNCGVCSFHSAVRKHQSYSRKNKVFSEQHSIFTVMIVRTGVFLYMLAVTILFGWGTYYLLSTYEERLNVIEYNGSADDLGKSSQDSFERTFQVTKLMASITAKSCPDADMWPNCSGISVPNYVEYVDSMVAINPQVRSVALNPFITSDQVSSFEAFAYKFYAEQGHGPNDTIPFGINPDFGKGIYARDSNGNLYHTTTAYTLGQHSILAPILLQGKLAQNLDSLMFNVYSETARVAGIDDMITCINASLPEDAVNCGSVTDFIRLVQDAFTAMRPAALFYVPIFPTNDPTTLVGASFSVFNWDIVLGGHLASNVGAVHAVLTTGLQTFTFYVTETEVYVEGEGDVHSSNLNIYRRTFVLTHPSISTLQYTLHIYPADALTYKSSFPIIGCILAILVIAVTSFVVFIYDQIVSKDARERELIGETKRLFVRYVSHEIRTPLNTVHLGLVFLHSDIVRILKEVESIVPKSVYDEMSTWVDLVEEIEDSADIAVTVLNDLINYDKIVMGSLNLETSEVPILECVQDTVRPFQVQARERNIALRFKAQRLSYLETLICTVDVVKIEQVIRNLVCNALKFTPVDGEVIVSVSLDRGNEMDWLPSEELSVDSSDSNPVNYSLLTRVGMIHIAVKDSGVGMSKENLANLFQEGVQFNANQLQGGKGSGLGLWVSKGFAKRHNGDIKAESDGVGCGSTFTLMLPCYERPSLVKEMIGLKKNGSDCSRANSDASVSEGSGISIPLDPLKSVDASMSDVDVEIGCGSGSNDSFGVGCPTIVAADYENLNSDDAEPTVSIDPTSPSATSPASVPTPTPTPTLAPASSSASASTSAVSATIAPQQSSATGDDEEQYVTLGPKKLKKGQAVAQHDIDSCDSFKNILVVDDSVPNRKILCRLLKNGGFTCTQAENGQLAFDLVASSLDAYDMILMDFEMPVMDGPAATKAIREAGYTRPIVGITGNVLESDRTIFLTAGANDVLYKPLTMSAFNECIKKMAARVERSLSI